LTRGFGCGVGITSAGSHRENIHDRKTKLREARTSIKTEAGMLEADFSKMSSTTPQAGSSLKRSNSGSHRPISRPTTPLRPSSRSSLRESGKSSAGGISDAPIEAFEPAFAELSDSMADLEANFMHLQLMHESLARFSENFASFLYGLNMNAFCVDFPEVRLGNGLHQII
jgi:DASH complex subunit DAM1